MQTDSIHLGKIWGLRRMANEAAHFTMVALDQRPPIVNLVAALTGKRVRRLGVPSFSVQ